MAGNHRSGRKPKPENLRLLEGGKAVKRSGDRDEAPGEPPMPEFVRTDAVASRYWREYADVLLALRVLVPSSRMLLGLLATQSAAYERALADWSRVNFQLVTVEQVAGRAKAVELPFRRAASDLASNVARLLGEFGLTPVTAEKVARQAAPAEVSKWEKLTGAKK